MDDCLDEQLKKMYLVNLAVGLADYCILTRVGTSWDLIDSILKIRVRVDSCRLRSANPQIEDNGLLALRGSCHHELVAGGGHGHGHG